ncbi:hypothetical protein AUK10_02570 [Candidatus Gracilibacteria bacterium CG2_30_37_12]|nr:MAG: hypothetical protein AUK10_02570 [Candidatus Gracilibacteria bacterium CG2_30_37_12]
MADKTITETSCDVKMYGSVTVGTKGQVVIPKEIRDDLSINPGDILMILTKHGKAIGMIKADDMPAFMEYMQQEMKA